MQNGFYDEDEIYENREKGSVLSEEERYSDEEPNAGPVKRSVFSPGKERGRPSKAEPEPYEEIQPMPDPEEYGFSDDEEASSGGFYDYDYGVEGGNDDDSQGRRQEDLSGRILSNPGMEDDDDEFDDDSWGLFRKRKSRDEMTEEELEKHKAIFGEYEDEDGIKGKIAAFVFNISKPNLIIKFLIVTAIISYLLMGVLQYIEMPLLDYTGAETMNHTWIPGLLHIGMLKFHPILMLISIIVGASTGMTVCAANWKYVHDKIADFKYSKKTSKGSAHFATDEEMENGAAEFQPKRKPQGIVLGINDKKEPENGGMAVCVSPMLAQNVAVYGPTGTGKSRNYMRPNILTCIDNRISFVATDPAGELFRDTAKLASEKGMCVKVINFSKLDASNGWDCFAEIKKLWAEGMRLEAETAIDILVKTIIDNTEDDYSKSDPYYSAIETNLLSFLVKYVAISPYFAGEEYERNLGTCYEILVELMGGNGNIPIFESIKGRLDEPARTNWTIFSGYGQKQKESAMSGLEGKIGIFNNEMLKEIFAHDEIDMALPGSEPCAYYVISPVTTKRYQFLLSLFFSIIFQTLITEAEKNGGKLKNPVRFLLDEFAAIGQINDFEPKISNVRKYGISISIIFQDPSQIERNYPDLSRSILANCPAHLIMGVNDNETAEETSKRIGTATIEDKSVRHEKKRFNPLYIYTAGQETEMESERLLAQPDEIMRMRDTFKGKYLVTIMGKNVYPVTPYEYSNHYLAEYIDKDENHWEPRNYIPDWQNEQKAMDLKHTFRGMSEEAGGGFGRSSYSGDRNYGQGGMRKPVFDPNGNGETPVAPKDDDSVVVDNRKPKVPGQKVIRRQKKSFVPHDDDTGNCIQLEDVEVEKGDTANRLTMEMLDDIDLI